MNEIYEILSKQWDLITGIHNVNKFDSLNSSSEKASASELGRIILLNNLDVLKYSSIENEKILNSYNTLVDQFPIESQLFLNTNVLINPCDFDYIGNIFEDYIHNNGTRKGSGQFYSPQVVVDYMIHSLNLNLEDDLHNKTFIDIACGSGIFLIHAIKYFVDACKVRNIDDFNILKSIVNNFYGLDINEISCLITKINIFNLLVILFRFETINKMDKDIALNIFNTNSIDRNTLLVDNYNEVVTTSTDIHNEDEQKISKIKNKASSFAQGFTYVIGNPPYLEAKKMSSDLKVICQTNFGEFTKGAFDLYIAFIAQCNNLVSKDGIVTLILPNKFLVAKYASTIRDYISQHFSILEIDDLSEMDIFKKADVYPIVIKYKNTIAIQDYKVNTKLSIRNFEELCDDSKLAPVHQSMFKTFNDLSTYFCLPPIGDFDNLLFKLFKDNKTIGDYIRFYSAVSFHKKGLREQYVRNDFSDHDFEILNLRKYLGGVSYSKKNEVEKYKINWNGYFINYDRESLKSIGNFIPPLDHFEREKIILCQHAKEITATYDKCGEWISKDVFPIAIRKDTLQDSVLSLKYFTALLNSKLFSFIYGIIFKGVQISAGYYHYLPTWLEILPVIEPSLEVVSEIEHLVDNLLDYTSLILNKEETLKEIDNYIYKVYGINSTQKQIIEKFNK